MEVEDMLKAINKLTGFKFVKIENGTVFDVATGKVVPLEHIFCQKVTKEDGFYRCSEATCRGVESNCYIGKPSPKCVERKIYSEKKCAVYHLHTLDDSFISIEDCLKVKETP